MKSCTSYIDYVNFILATEGITPICVTHLQGKSHEPKFRVDSFDGAFFVKISDANRFSENFIQLLHQNSDFCVLPIISKNIPEINRQLNVYAWLDGTDLKTILGSYKRQENYEYGVKCGILLSRLHSISADNISNCFDIDKRLEMLFDFLKSDKCKLNYKSFWLEYLYENISLLKRRSNKRIIHFDFKPKNIMLSNEKLFIVDFDSFSIGDPWFDFYDKGLALYPQKQIFNKGIIDGYFNQKIPSDFWHFFKAVSVFGLVQCAFWTINRTNEKYIIDVEHYLLDSYNNFTIDIPLWYRSDTMFYD